MRKTGKKEDTEPIEFINLSESSFTSSPNQNINPTRTPFILMADDDNNDNEEEQHDQRPRPIQAIAIHTPIKVKKFTGSKTDNAKVEDWIRDFKEAAAANQWITDAQKVTHLKHNLDGMAMNWFRARFADDEPDDVDFRDVITELQAQFGAARPKLKYLKELHTLQQREDESVQDYYCTMLGLLRGADIDLDSQRAVDYVITGLKPSLAARVYADEGKYQTTADLFKKLKILDEAEGHRRKAVEDSDDLIMAADEDRRRNDRRRGSVHREPSPQCESMIDREGDRRSSGSRRGSVHRDPSPGYENNNSERAPDFNSRAEALRRAPSPVRYRSDQETQTAQAPRVHWQDNHEDTQCFKCNQMGHWAKDCRSRQYMGQDPRQGNARAGSATPWSGPRNNNQQRDQNARQSWCSPRNTRN